MALNQMKTCATCRHLKVVEQGREFELILDTEYTLFQCGVLNWKKKEFYLMAPVPRELDDTGDTACEYWEYWKSEEKTSGNNG
jgi:hypothetical protein